MHVVQYQTLTGWFGTMVTTCPLMAPLLTVQVLTLPWVLVLTVQRLRMIGMNIPTNEMTTASLSLGHCPPEGIRMEPI